MKKAEQGFTDSRRGSDDIAEIVSNGQVFGRKNVSEKEKLLRLEEELHKRVVGQDEAIKAVADAVEDQGQDCRIRNDVGSPSLSATGVEGRQAARLLPNSFQ